MLLVMNVCAIVLIVASLEDEIRANLDALEKLLG
jgi:hypothetical protein